VSWVYSVYGVVSPRSDGLLASATYIDLIAPPPSNWCEFSLHSPSRPQFWGCSLRPLCVPPAQKFLLSRTFFQNRQSTNHTRIPSRQLTHKGSTLMSWERACRDRVQLEKKFRHFCASETHSVMRFEEGSVIAASRLPTHSVLFALGNARASVTVNHEAEA
jgi:hypothetical protein